MQKKYILAIETSCDDTSIAISCNHSILSNITISSTKQHKKYGGIVPELAARSHEANLNHCLQLALKKARININQITHVAYTSFPGLPGSLHLGKIFAKSMASLLDIPLVPVNHMYGHIFSFILEDTQDIQYPFLSLIVSGGHTAIFLIKNINEIQILTETTDDAVGETLDKVGRILKLPYPGGIAIDKIYSAKKNTTPMIRHFEPNKPFSFSGIKTHILNLVNKYKMQNKKLDKADIASSLLNWIMEEIKIKLQYYINLRPEINFLTIGGGVSANRLLRKSITSLPVKVILPRLKYTNDNAAMIAAYAHLLIKQMDVIRRNKI